MESNDSESEWNARVEERDKRTPSPENRAGWIYRELKAKYPNLNNWDLICFCIEFLGSSVIAYEWLDKESVRKLSQQVFIAHYALEEVPDTGIIFTTEEKSN